MEKQDPGDDLSKEIREQNKMLFRCDLLRPTATNIGTYSFDMARNNGRCQRFQNRAKILHRTFLIGSVSVIVRVAFGAYYVSRPTAKALKTAKQQPAVEQTVQSVGLKTVLHSGKPPQPHVVFGDYPSD